MPELSAADAARLDDYRFQMGHDAGNLALTLDRLTDVVRLVGQHTTYCRVGRGPRTDQPPLDVVEVLELLAGAKALVQETLMRLRG